MAYYKKELNTDITTLEPKIFEMIVNHLPYNPNLANLSMTSKKMQSKVLETASGNYALKLNALTPSYLRAFLAEDDGFLTFITAGYYLGAGIGAYANYDTYLSTYLGALGGVIISSIVSGAVGGYVIDGFEGAKQGASFLPKFFPTPTACAKFIFKMQLNATDALFSYSGKQFQKYIKEAASELAHEYIKTCHRNFSIFKEQNINFKYDLQNTRDEMKERLRQPITRHGI